MSDIQDKPVRRKIIRRRVVSGPSWGFIIGVILLLTFIVFVLPLTKYWGDFPLIIRAPIRIVNKAGSMVVPQILNNQFHWTAYYVNAYL